LSGHGVADAGLAAAAPVGVVTLLAEVDDPVDGA
jgi:hypothetical protein